MSGIDVDPLVFARCAGFMLRAPGFSHAGVPRPLRAGLALVLAIAIESAAPRAQVRGGTFVLALVGEFLVGLALALAASVVYDAAAAAGQTLDAYIGFQVSNPGATGATPGEGFGRLWGIAFVTAFFVLGGYVPVIAALARTLVDVPPGSAVDVPHLARTTLALPGAVARTALVVAGPAIALALVVQVAIAAVTRIIPRYANLQLGFPLAFVAVVLVTLAAFPAVIALASRPGVGP